MSKQKAVNEALRWLNTAKEDMEAAEILKDAKKYAHACFLLQQAAEKAIKALYYKNEENPWGHSCKKLIEDLQSVNLDTYKALKPFEEKGGILDRFYIPTRYPNGLPDITPTEAYTREDVEMGEEIAKGILEAAEKIIRR